MPVLIALAGLAVGVYFFLIRTRNAAHAAGDLLDMANDVRLAARRFGFRRQANAHPIEAIEDSNLAIAALTVGFLELDGLPTQDQFDRLVVQLCKHLNTDSETA